MPALETVAAQQPEVVFLDIRMPGATGIEVARAMREVSPRSQVVSRHHMTSTPWMSFEHGAVDYLLKPIGRERLQATWATRCNNAPIAGRRMARCWRLCCSVCPRARPLPATRRRSPG
ncbi:LytR/AlgR family response regulator transcription factor [Xanthomonas axonopodis]